MLISRTWLADLLHGTVDVDALDDAALASALTGLGLEVESVTRHGDGLGDVVVARVLAVAPHPSADRLRVVEVDDGAGRQQVVCGAPNVPEPGGLVLFARPGTVLPSGMAIGVRAVRDVASAGMLCSETELDIGSDDDGIVVLDEPFEPGTPIARACRGVSDTVIEISVTPNRPDALGHVGVARDLAVKLGKRWQPPTTTPEVAQHDATIASIEAPDGCGRYYGITLAGATIGRSPWAARVRLHRLGLRPLGNAIDITNLMLMKWGQPLHVFDRDQLAGGRVIVRRANVDEPMRTLDDRDLVLGPEDLVIADTTKPMALAGVMGGAQSGVQPGTTRLLLEAAWFHPAGIRRTARRHGIATDSSHRFERGVDHGPGLAAACAEALALLVAWTGAVPEAMTIAQGHAPPVRTIVFRPTRCDLLLGLAIDRAQMHRIFDGIGVVVDDADAAAWRCRVPTHRPDLEREVDLVDEVIRHHGLESLPAAAGAPRPSTDTGDADVRMRARVVAAISDALREQGLHEVVSLAFARPEALAAVGDDPDGPAIVRLANPMRHEAASLRTHLLPGLLDALAINVARHPRPVALFECGRTYRHAPTRAVAPRDAELPHEPLGAAVLHGATAGTAAELARRTGGALMHALRRTGAIGRASDATAKVAWLHPGAQAELVLGDGTVVGRFGVVHPDVLARWDLPRAVAVAYGELALDRIAAITTPRLQALPRFPGSSRDVSIDIAAHVSVATVIGALEAAARAVPVAGDDPPRLVTGAPDAPAIELVEDYRDGNVGADRRALLLRLHYAASGRTSTDAEVQAMHELAVTRACEQLAALDPRVRRR
jgi:phenylalanyl-tRNA synthetase beta chain